jgi:MFS family permease
MEMRIHPVTAYLQRARPSLFNFYCIFAAFFTYFCMYAFRRPFATALYDGMIQLPFLPMMDYKILLIVSQVFGYTLSKFIGIKIVSEMSSQKRAFAIVLMIGLAELALLGFALAPYEWKPVFLFLNGIPLGMIWGLVFGFLEGRRSTELLGAGLSASYIVASGAVRSAGSFVLTLGVSEFWMPFVTGLLFFPPLLFFVYLLKLIPAPTKEDEALRMKRQPMDKKARRAFFLRFAPGLVALTGLYMLLTAYRDFRENFAREIWDATGYAGKPEIFAMTELPIAIAVLIALAFMMKIKNNERAMTVIHCLMLGGSLMIGLSTLAFQAGLINPVAWMVMIGMGLYLAYVPYGCILFDRLIACMGVVATAGFLIYVTDAFGYLGSVSLMLYRTFGQPDLSWLNFFISFSYITSAICAVCFTFSMFYFRGQTFGVTKEPAHLTPEPALYSVSSALRAELAMTVVSNDDFSEKDPSSGGPVLGAAPATSRKPRGPERTL